MDSITIEAPAKINFGLNIVSKRQDGFHNIETIFYPVKIFDTLKINKADEFFFSCNTVLGNTDDNLVVRAVKLLESFTNSSLPCSIELTKKIPAGAGMGGGSSDAAATLSALIRLFDLKIEKNDLMQIALSLGSDVPFFLNAVPSYAESRGERLFDAELEIDLPILIVNPGINISTAQAYSMITPEPAGGKLKSLSGKISQMDRAALKKTVTNDFEEVVFREYPAIKNIKQKMYDTGAIFSLMTGTGSTVFGIYKNTNAASEALNTFPSEYFRTIC